ncbi:DNA polymerase III subunit gamma/tau [Malacoplasma penetrans]|uniref:DNA polymerase III subunit gamma/tau n=1 Tax=Malacoplasma penetrans TaxID=28227 RepID=UPI0013E90689|nr:DNA polymerase III subunit gamma/tau [Malacoplasma penetrans]
MNNKIAFYRKYRPNSFNEIIGQKFIIKTLSNSIIKNKQSHAYIFSGPKGVGKTSIAKIFSKVLNCLNLKDGDCCNNCNNCNLINQNQAVDIVELDAASNNGVGEVRNIIDTINYLPSVLKYKVYIIDEAHMLSNAAWNAFLKLIEDPPKYLVFIFATTESYKFPPTIISRCQRYNFLKLNNSELKECLKSIAKKEKIKVEDNALNKIAELADGSLRDACSLIDQLDSYTNSDIKIEDIYNVFGILDVNEKINLLKSVWNSNVEQIINKINEYEVKGIDFYQLSIDLINLLYDKLVYERTKNVSLLKYLPSEQTNFLELQPKFIIKCLEVWQDNLNKIKTSSNPKFYFQLSCFESCKLFEFEFDTNLTANSYVVKNETELKEQLEQKVKPTKKETVKVELTEKNKPDKLKEEIKAEEIKVKPSKKEEIVEEKVIEQEKENNSAQEPILDTSNFKQVKLSESMKVVQIKGKPEGKKEVIEPQNKKINIVDNFVDNFVQVDHLDKDSDIFDEFGIVGKKSKAKTNKANKPKEVIKEEVIEKEIVKAPEVVVEKTEKKKPKTKSIESSSEQLSLFSFDNIEADSPTDYLEEQFESIEEENITEDSNVNTKKGNVDPTKEPIELPKDKKENKVEKKEEIAKPITQSVNKVKEEESFKEIDIDEAFLKIAVNSNNSEKEKVNNFFKSIKDSMPSNSFESSIKQMDRLIVVSNNGIAFSSADDLEIENINKINQSLEFLEYLKNKLNKVYLVIAITKDQAIKVGNEIRNNKLSPSNTKDVDIEFLNTKIKSKPTAKDLVESMLSELIIDEE